MLFNESWGVNGIVNVKEQQQFVDATYQYMKSWDSTRLIIGNDGWEQTATDVVTVHDYTNDHMNMRENYNPLLKNVDGCYSTTSLRKNFANGYSYNNQPIIISEFGGIAYSKNKKNTWGYGKRLEDKVDVLQKIEELTSEILNIEGLSGFCYTQWTDVQQEVNGLLDENHELKFDMEEIQNIFKKKKNGGFIFE